VEQGVWLLNQAACVEVCDAIATGHVSGDDFKKKLSRLTKPH